VKKVLYVRVSSLEGQNTDRQKVEQSNYDFVIEDRCSGTIPFFERNGGKEIMKLVEAGTKMSLSVWQLDRLGRNLRDILNTIHFFTEKNIPIIFEAQNLRTLDEDGNQNHMSQFFIGMLSAVSQMERDMILDRIRTGVQLAKLKGKFQGRKKGTSEDVVKFLSKEKNKKALEYLKKGYTQTDIAELTGLHINTISKIKKVWQKSIQ
jgi:DNA invertase Pin-like site-specific DNA recombinase